MTRTPKFDKQVREAAFAELENLTLDSAMFGTAKVTCEGLTFPVGLDQDGVTRFASLKVVVHNQGYDLDEAANEKAFKVDEAARKAAEREAKAKAKKDKAAKAE